MPARLSFPNAGAVVAGGTLGLAFAFAGNQPDVSPWVWIGIATSGIVLLPVTRYITKRIRARRERTEPPYNSADDALGQGIINSILDLFLP